MLGYIEEFIYNVKKVFTGIQPGDMAPQIPLVYNYHKSDPVKIRLKYKSMMTIVKHDLGFTPHVYEKLTEPLIKWLSEFLLYLPASEHFHHIEPGAFYLHCLQTANKAAQLASNNSSLFFNVNLEDRAKYQLNFVYAAWIGGLIHDIGKPIVDMDVYAVDRDRVWLRDIPTWSPLDETLDSWCINNRVKWYRVVFTRDKDKENHELYISAFIERMLDKIPAVEIDKRLIFDFLISINTKTSKLNNVVSKADSLSTGHDIVRYDKVGVFNTPIACFVRAIVDYEFDFSNSTSKPYFRSEIGIHIHYPQGMKTLIEYMFSKFTKEDLDFLNVSTDTRYWIDMLRNHRFLVVDIDGKDNFSGSFPYISKYIYDVSVMDDGVDQTFTCVTMTRDSRIPLNVDCLDLKEVNLVRVLDKSDISSGTLDISRNSLHHNDELQNVESNSVKEKVSDMSDIKAGDKCNTQILEEYPKNDVKEVEEAISMATSQAIIEGENKSAIPKYVNDSVSQIMSEINMFSESNEVVTVPDIKEKDDVVEELLGLNILEPDILEEFLKIEYSEHPIYVEYYLNSEFRNYSALVLFLIGIETLIAKDIVNIFDENSNLVLNKEGLNIYQSFFSLVFQSVDFKENSYFIQKKCIEYLKKYINEVPLENNLLFDVIYMKERRYVFNHAIAKFLCFTKKDVIKPLIQTGEVYLPLSDQENKLKI